MADKVVNASSYAGAAVSVIFSLTLTEWGVIVGILTALITLAANQLWQIRKDRREAYAQAASDRRAQQLHDLEVQRICTDMSMRGARACMGGDDE